MPLARRGICEWRAAYQFERNRQSLVAGSVDPVRGEDLQPLPVRADGRMKCDPPGVRVRQVRLSNTTGAEPAAQPAHVGTPSALSYGQCRNHGLCGPSWVLQQPGAILQTLLGGARRHSTRGTEQLDGT